MRYTSAQSPPVGRYSAQRTERLALFNALSLGGDRFGVRGLASYGLPQMLSRKASSLVDQQGKKKEDHLAHNTRTLQARRRCGCRIKSHLPGWAMSAFSDPRKNKNIFPVSKASRSQILFVDPDFTERENSQGRIPTSHQQYRRIKFHATQ